MQTSLIRRRLDYFLNKGPVCKISNMCVGAHVGGPFHLSQRILNSIVESNFFSPFSLRESSTRLLGSEAPGPVPDPSPRL